MDPNAQNPATPVDPNAPVQTPVMPGSDQPVAPIADPMGTPAPVEPTMPTPPAMPEPMAPVATPEPMAGEQPAETPVGDVNGGMPPTVPPAV